MRAYAMDLRERVRRDSDAGLPAAAVAVQYHVSASWVRRLKQRRRETGDVAPRQQRYGRQPVRAHHHERNHQGLDNRLILPLSTAPPPRGRVPCRQRLGGMLHYDYRSAA